MAPLADLDLTLPGVALRPGVTVDVHVRVFADETRDPASCGASTTALAVPGFAHTAATWDAFATALFAERANNVCRLVAFDPPGHGQSGVPTALPFAYLTLDDYATALLGTLQQLPALGFAPRALIGHSQGGMVVQLAQQRLTSGGSSLRTAHGIQEVVLLSPTMPAGLGWAFADNGTAGGLLSNFVVPTDPMLGTHFRIPDPVWPILFFSNLDGQVATGAPSAADVAARGYNAPEPLLAALQLVGASPFPGRPAVDAGIFSGGRGTQLTVLAFEHDQLIRPAEASALFGHLTAGNNGGKFAVLSGDQAVHDLYVSNPAALLAGTRVIVP